MRKNLKTVNRENQKPEEEPQRRMFLPGTDRRDINVTGTEQPRSFAGHHLDNQRLNDDMRLNISSLVRLGRLGRLVKGPEKTTESDSVLEKQKPTQH